MIPYGRQEITNEDIESVVEVLKSDWLTQGPKIQEFEQAVANYSGAQHGVAVNSATSGLHIACLALGLGAGDILWTSPNTFVASANCGLYCGAIVDFVDIDPDTYNIDTKALETKLELAKAEGTLPKIVIPVHFAGQSCDMRKIRSLAEQYGFYIIEDASHAIGGRYLGEPIGCCRYSDITVFSFHPVKIITTGEGGMVLSNNGDLVNKILRLRSHGITRDIEEMESSPHGPWYYEQKELGFNYRMTDIQAALGTSQIKRVDKFISRRLELVELYHKKLEGLPVTTPKQSPECEPSWHLYVIRLNLNDIQKSRREVFEEMRDAGIGVNVHYIPVHTQPYYQQLGFNPDDFSNAMNYYEGAITFRGKVAM